MTDVKATIALTVSEYASLKELHARVKLITDDLENQIEAIRDSRHPKGMSVPYFGPFASAAPSVVKDLERLVKALREALV
jgi:hypothetical protein